MAKILVIVIAYIKIMIKVKHVSAFPSSSFSVHVNILTLFSPTKMESYIVISILLSKFSCITYSFVSMVLKTSDFY